mgnify:FL=1
MTLAVSKHKLRVELTAKQIRKNRAEDWRSNCMMMYKFEANIYLRNLVSWLREGYVWVGTPRATYILSNQGTEQARKNIEQKLRRWKADPIRSGFIQGKHWKKDTRIKWNIPEILLLFPLNDEDVENSKVFKVFENLSKDSLDILDEIGEDELLKQLLKFSLSN